jgi:hypothetical protein
MSTAAPEKTTTNVLRVPPDERFWRRYSPHHELPLSSASSVALHLLVVGLAALACMLPIFNREQRPMELSSVTFGDGGGQPDGADASRGKAGIPGDEQNPPTVKAPFQDKVPDVSPTVDTKAHIPTLPDAQELDPDRTISDLDKFLEDARKRPRTPKDPYAGRGPDNGAPKGEGPGAPGGNNVVNEHIRRFQRWTMKFNTQDGQDYVKQLQSLKAILAIELPGDPTKATVYRDLSAPMKAEVEELKSIRRIQWFDKKPESVHALCRALRIKPVPERVIAFLPLSLEDKLLHLELEYAKGKSEEEIIETVFEVKSRGDGRYEPVVVGQVLR